MTATAEKIDLDACEREVRENIDRLEADLARLSLDALAPDRDPEVESELRDVEHQLGRAHGELHRLSLARVEQSRRLTQAQQDAQMAARRAAMADAKKLAGQRTKAAEAVDGATRAYVEALVKWRRLATEQEAAVRRAGRDGTSVRPHHWQIESGLKLALRNAGIPDAIELGISAGDKDWTASRIKPLAEFDRSMAHCQLADL